MKKIFTIDSLIVCFISGLGYGLAFEIPKILGYEMWQSSIICLAVGGILDAVATRIIFSKVVQNNNLNRILVFIAYFLIFLGVQYVVLSWKDLPVLEYLLGQYLYVIIPAILGFAISATKRWYLTRKIRKRYGDGSKGFLYDDMLSRAEIEEFNKQNQPIKGKYNTKLAVKTKTGIFVGYKEKKCMFFSGIPYAKPPVGNLRWKAPQPLPESEKVFEAKYFGASAVQVEHEGSILKHHRQSEDCLTLNIGFKNLDTDKKKPVMVLFHHGDFSYGGSADPLMYGEGLTKIYSDFVGVSFNYRLGIFGFIDFSDIPGGENYPDALNLGLLDQIAALKWIKENISAFGGDPNNITVVGFESGAISISLLAACKEAKGLFQRAFIFSGSTENAFETPDFSKKLAENLLKETSTNTMQELQQLSTEKLKAAAQKLFTNTAAAPTCDGKLIPADIFKNYHNVTNKGIDFIIGIPSDEVQIYKSFVGEEIYKKFLTERVNGILPVLDKNTAKAVQNYIDTPDLEVKAKFCEQWNALTMYSDAMQLAAAGNKVRLLYWNVKPLIENLGAGTVAVASAFLGNTQASQMYGNVLDSNISKIFQTFMTKFLKGDALQLYNNEIKGVNALNWEEFPKALIVTNENFKCELVENYLTEIKSLLDFFKNIIGK